jgi:parvulin-like peptidyl-prolyl isomerase
MLRILLIAISFIMLFSCSDDDSNRVVATVNGESLTYAELEAFATRQSKEPNLKSMKDKSIENVLKKTTEKMLVAQAAKKEGLDKNADFMNEYTQQRKIWLAQYLYWEELLGRLYSEEDYIKYHERMNLKVTASHILLGYKGAKNSNVERSKTEALELAEKVYTEATTDTTDFATLAKQYSEGPTKNKGGALQPFTVGSMVAPFEEAVFNMADGEISKPVETVFGYHIIKKVKTQEAGEADSFDNPNERARVYKALAQKNGRSLQGLFRSVTDSLKTAMNGEFNNENLAWFAGELRQMNEMFDNKQKQQKNPQDQPRPKTPEYNFADQDLDRVIYQTDLFSYTFADYKKELGNRYDQQMRNVRSAEDLKKGLDNFLPLNVWYASSVKRGNEKAPWVLLQDKVFTTNKLYDYYRREVLEPKFSISQEDIEEYYQNNLDRYKNKAKMELFVIRQPDIEIAGKALQEARMGANWKRLVDQYSIGNLSEKKKNGKIGAHTENGYGEISKKAFEVGPNKLVPELVLQKNLFFIVKTGEYFPESNRPLSKVKHQIENNVRRSKLEKEYKQFIDAEKEKAKIEYLAFVSG